VIAASAVEKGVLERLFRAGGDGVVDDDNRLLELAELLFQFGVFSQVTSVLGNDGRHPGQGRFGVVGQVSDGALAVGKFTPS
jgi:hypothetical protein